LACAPELEKPGHVQHGGSKTVLDYREQAGLELLPVLLYFGGELRYPHSTNWYVHDPTGYSIEVVLWDEDQISFAGKLALAS
jgi:hypothetical protein